MRKLLIAVLTAILVVTGGAVAADFGTTIYAEYRLARTVRQVAGLSFDPSVAILGFPFIRQAMRHHYHEIEIKANGAPHPVVGKASLEATMHSVDLTDASWLIRPTAELRLGILESRIIIDSGHLGRFIGMKDLMVEAPSKDTNDTTGGTTESGISGSKGLVFTATDVQTGPGTADQAVPDDKKAAVLAAFSGSLPGQRLPFGVRPTTEGARGSDVIIEGITSGVTVRLDEFNQS